MITIFLLVLLGSPVLQSTGREQAVRPAVEEELSLPLIMERLAKVSPEGREVIERAKAMTPVIQKNRSARTLGETVEDCIQGRGQLIIYPIGWEALRGEGSRWKIFFYFKDQEKRYLKAGWEYNKDRNVLLPAEFTNATKFWVRRSENLNP